jgi:hypothetical protein
MSPETAVPEEEETPDTAASAVLADDVPAEEEEPEASLELPDDDPPHAARLRAMPAARIPAITLFFITIFSLVNLW